MHPPTLLLSALAAGLCAQSPSPVTSLPRFDAASVKVSTQGFLVIAPDRSGGRIHWTTDLTRVLGYAYRMAPWQMSGPIPGSVSIYEFNVVTGPDATDEQVRLMFQSLLADRFGMVSHREWKDVDGWALSLARGGPKMEEATDGKIPRLPEGLEGDPAAMEGYVVSRLTAPGVGNMAGRRVTMTQLAESLQRVFSTAVGDRTGLTGKYYFDIQYAAANAAPDITLPDLPTALKDLGLRLEKHRGPAEFLVVDRIQKVPTEN